MRPLNIYIILLVLPLFVLVGCRPRGVLSNQEFRDVLYDLHRADGIIQVAGYNYSHDTEVAGYYKQILDKHGITQAQFDSTLVWYTDNPQIFNKIYPKVIARLDADYEAEKAIRGAKRDKRLEDKKQQSEKERARILQEMQDYILWMRNGYENTWKIWQEEEFCEKNVIIFGQLEKK